MQIKKSTADRPSGLSNKILESVTEHKVPNGAPGPHGFLVYFIRYDGGFQGIK